MTRIREVASGGTKTKTVRGKSVESATANGGRGAVGALGAAGARKRRVSQAVHARREMRALREGRKRVWSKAPIRRQLRSLVLQLANRSYRVPPASMSILMEHLETWCTKRFAWAYILSLVADHTTLSEPELEVVFRMVDGHGRAPLYWSEAEYASLDNMFPATIRMKKFAEDKQAANEAGVSLKRYRAAKRPASRADKTVVEYLTSDTASEN